MQQLSIPQKLVLAGFVMIIGIIAGTCEIISMQREAAIAAFQTAAINLTKGMAQQTAHALAQDDRLLQETAQALGPAAPPAAVTSLLNARLAQLADVEGLAQIAPSGQVVNAASGWPANGLDVSNTDYFIHCKTIADQALYIGLPVRNPASGRWSVPMARRLQAPSGQFAGVIVATLSLQDLSQFYQLAMPPNRILYLARRDGVVLLRYPGRAAETGRQIPAGAPWYAAVAQGGGIYDGPSFFDNTTLLAAIRPLHDLPLVIEAAVPQAEVLAQWQQQRSWLITGAVLAGLGTIAVLRMFIRQFHKLEASRLMLAAKNGELETAQRQMQATLANISQAVCFFDAGNRLLVFNQRFCEITGLPPDAVKPGMSVTEIIEMRIARGTFVPRTAEAYLAELNAWIAAGRPVDDISTLTDGRTISRHVEPLQGNGWVMTLEDVSERRAAEARIYHLAHHDLLTDLANRALFRERLAQAFADTRPGSYFAVLCLDLDRFKAVNDQHGHAVGDSLLRAVADRLRAQVRATDTVARLGGDEFVILQCGVSNMAETTGLAHRVIKIIGEPFEISGHRLSIGVSIGIAVAPPNLMNPERMLLDADLALYQSKQEGRGHWRMYRPELALAGAPPASAAT